MLQYSQDDFLTTGFTNDSDDINSECIINETGAVDVGVQKEVQHDVYNEPNKVVKRKKGQPTQSAAAVLMAKLLDDQSKLAPQREYDELDRFFLNISDTVKKFSLYQQALVKNKIFSLVSEMELQLFSPHDTMPSPEYGYAYAYTLSPQSPSRVSPSTTSTQPSNI